MTTTQAPQLLTFRDAEAVLSRTLEGYTERPEQQDLATAVEDVIASLLRGEVKQLLGQAGTGVGKSIAYSVPAVLAAVNHGLRVVIATSTKALQEQIAGKDMPFLQENLGVPFTWALVKGRGNYLCEEKASQVTVMDIPSLPQIRAELEEGASGDREHFGINIHPREWAKLSSSANDCLGKQDCPFGDVCHAETAKRRARDAQIVITNTSMLMLDIQMRRISGGEVAMLGDYDLVVIDEAHELPEIATGALSTDIRSGQFDRLAVDAHSFADTQDAEVPAYQGVQSAVMMVWAELQMAMADRQHNDRNATSLQLPQSWLLEREELFFGLIASMKDLAKQLDKIDIVRGGDQAGRQRKRLKKRAYNMIDKLTHLLVDDDTQTVRWMEIENRTVRGQVTSDLLIKSSPIDVAPFLAATLWTKPAILISATLEAGGSFEYMTQTLGLTDPQIRNVGTPFDYEEQARLFIPPASAPDPSPRNKQQWTSYAQTVMLELVRASKGGALLLFTSGNAMRSAREQIGPVLEGMGLTVLMQGDAPNKALANTFKTDIHSVLFAMKSFFVGVDFAGDACRLVVIDKMPFPVPSDILFAARADAINRQYNDKWASFNRLSVPMMALTLAQGFGRLIRTHTDRGVVAILDNRLVTKSYGKGIVRSLPPAQVISTLPEAAAFYEG
jgi:ATP-dependent DNA helicase DinG